MSDASRIQWTEATWNPVTGCTRISEGCDHCYIERTPPFRMNGRRFSKSGIGGTTGVKLHSDRLHQPLHWRKPRRIFVNSLADLFHEQVPDSYVAEVFAVMALTPHHNYQVLTKRHSRMRALIGGHRRMETWVRTIAAQQYRQPLPVGLWPLPNVWLGVSAENQPWADLRIPALLDTPAAVRWVSAEPLLGPLDLDRYLDLDWVVAGGESGPGARPMDPQWATALVEQCRAAGVPMFVKQLGSQWGRTHHDIETFPPALRVRDYPEGATQ